MWIKKERPSASGFVSYAKEDSADASPSQPSDYQNCSLPSPTAVRLIQLLPGKDSEPISRSLRPVKLEDTQPFEALSCV
jgi:hypothetical protein